MSKDKSYLRRGKTAFIGHPGVPFSGVQQEVVRIISRAFWGSSMVVRHPGNQNRAPDFELVDDVCGLDQPRTDLANLMAKGTDFKLRHPEIKHNTAAVNRAKLGGRRSF